MYIRISYDERPFVGLRHWLFWHQPRAWRHRAYVRAASKLRCLPRFKTRTDNICFPRGPLIITEVKFQQ